MLISRETDLVTVKIAGRTDLVNDKMPR